MFSKTPVELLVKDASNIYNKCQSLLELVQSRCYDENLVILTTAEVYAIAEKLYLRCDTFTELQTDEISNYINAFDDFYFQLKQILFHDKDDYALLASHLERMNVCFEKLYKLYDLF